MATYTELRQLFSNPDLREKVEVAVIIAANDLISGTPTAAQTAWAAQCFASPANEASKALMAVLASNAALTTAQILAATDEQLQMRVDAAVQTLVDASAGA